MGPHTNRLGLLLVLILAFGLLGMSPNLDTAGMLDEHDEDEGGEPPLPNPAFTEQVDGEPCTVTSEYEAAQYGKEVGDLIYDEGCERIEFAFGPIVVKPGENDALIEPVTIEKPAYDGYMTRFEPDMLRAVDGQPPPTHQLHVHHATWLHEYGSGPFAASGEEKTIRTYPEGYGLPIAADDTWLLLYMLHTDIAEPQVVWLTYNIDFIDTETAEEEHGIVEALPIWRDVMTDPMPHEGMVNRGGNPIFNVHKGFGSTDPETGRQVCVWPKENCARHDAYLEVNVHQGDPGEGEDPDKYDIKGTDWEVPEHLSGTLILGAGHVHPGGTRVEISQVRDGVEKPIIISDAWYWDPDDPTRIGGSPISWNFSMTQNNASTGWKVKIKPGDIIRINGVYDTEEASWYGQMGILNIHVAPDDPHGPPGVDVFDDDVVLDRGVSTQNTFLPEGPYDPKTNWRPHECTPDLTGESGQKRLCLRGPATHGHMHESGHFDGGCQDPEDCPDLTDERGPVVSDIVSVGFTYGNADLGVIDQTGMPQVELGETVRMWNFDTVARAWHSFTRCAYPCNGPSAIHYPLADGGSGDPWDWMDFDSGELGYGTFLDQTKSQPVTGQGNKSTEEVARDGLFWEFEPTETGVYTFWCRIHRGMRGAIEVVEPA